MLVVRHGPGTARYTLPRTRTSREGLHYRQRQPVDVIPILAVPVDAERLEPEGSTPAGCAGFILRPMHSDPLLAQPQSLRKMVTNGL